MEYVLLGFRAPEMVRFGNSVGVCGVIILFFVFVDNYFYMGIMGLSTTLWYLETWRQAQEFSS